MRAQALGLSRALGGILQAEVLEKTVPLPQGWEERDGRPDVVVACGSAAIFPALNLKRRFGTFAVFTQRPAWGGFLFDAVLRPRHDGPGGKNTLSIVGAVGPVSGDALKARRAGAVARFGDGGRPRIGVLLGGGNRAFAFSAGECLRIRERVLRLREATGGTILATASRRTGAENVRALGEGFLWEDGLGNPYMDILAAADVLLVTGDSVNMLSEACSAGRPVLIFPPVARGGVRGRLAAGKFLAFHADLEARGLARVWRGGEGWEGWERWEAPGLDETARAAEWLAEKIRARNGGRGFAKQSLA